MTWGASRKVLLSLKCCFQFCAFSFASLLLVYIAYPWIFATNEFLVFEIESWLYHLVISSPTSYHWKPWSSYINSTVDKHIMVQSLLFFLCNFCSYFSCAVGVLATNFFYFTDDMFGYAANHNTQGAFCSAVILSTVSGVLKP